MAEKSDWIVALSKGAIGSIPFVGPLAAEVVGVLIPNQRLDRLERFLEKLEAQVGQFDDRDAVVNRFRDPQFVDLLEDGFYQAARSLSDERLEYIASLVAHGLSSDEVEHLHLKKMLSILNSLNDAEVLFLIMFGRITTNEQSAFIEQHRDVLYPKLVVMGSSEDEVEAGLMQSSFKQHLAEVGLTRPNFKTPRRGELPEFDEKTGMMKASGYTITQLGRMLLKYIGQPARF